MKERARERGRDYPRTFAHGFAATYKPAFMLGHACHIVSRTAIKWNGMDRSRRPELPAVIEMETQSCRKLDEKPALGLVLPHAARVVYPRSCFVNCHPCGCIKPISPTPL